jgi:glycosyltransferase involved in cell wall biosynthesis
MKVVFVTTSYPRDEGDYAGRFVADLAERLRGRGVEVDVVAPGSFRDFGLAYGAGLTKNAKRKPWAVPPLVASMARAVRRAARDADLVHAHWLPNVVPALAARRPLVTTLHGSDVALLARFPSLLRLLVGRARVAVAVSDAVAETVRRLGVANVRVIRNGVELPAAGADGEAEPPELLFVGRLVPEKGIEELLEAAEGRNLVVVGDGPLRQEVPAALGFLSGAELEERYARAAVVVCPSRREGFGLVCAEAMARARPVVASAVGGLSELVADRETGLLVPARDPRALRTAIDSLLADQALRRRMGEAGRKRIAELCDWDRVVDAYLETYEAALSG